MTKQANFRELLVAHSKQPAPLFPHPAGNEAHTPITVGFSLLPGSRSQPQPWYHFFGGEG